MRVLVLEYVTGGGLAKDALPPSLAREGDLMLRALVKDLAALPGVEVVTTRDARLDGSGLEAEVHEVGPETEPWTLWRGLLGRVDALWPVAPESGGLLARMTGMAGGTGCTLLGSRCEAVDLTTSKRGTAARLAAHGIAVAGGSPGQGGSGWVVKPDDGAGCEETFFCADEEGLAARLKATPTAGDVVVQPYVPGTAGSLSLLCQEGAAWVLTCNRQDIEIRDGRFFYRGGVVGGLEEHRKDCEPLAGAVARAVTGLWGHVGIDFVMTGEGPVAVEVNPRPTTSYCALKQAIGRNPAALAMALLDHPLPDLRRSLDIRAVPMDLGLCHA